MKQTAIKWLYKLSKKRELDKFDLQQAIEMEKQQMEKIAEDFYYGSYSYKKFEQYYNETFGGEK
jgi:hypothetical protein